MRLRYAFAFVWLIGCGAPERPTTAAPLPPATRTASPEPAPSAKIETHEACEPLRVDRPAWQADVLSAAVPPIERSERLASFFDALAGLERGRRKEPVRIGIWGDSNLTLDEVSGTLRRIVQQRFGDAGHGFVGVGNPFRGYRHMDVGRTHIGHWETYIFTRGKRPKRGGFGAAGMAAATAERRARVRFETAEPGAPVGTRAGTFGVFYLKQPDGGRFSIAVDDERRAVVDTAAAGESVGYEELLVSDGPHRFEVENQEQRRWIQLYGVVLERSVPGVVVDSFGVTGATFGTIAALDPASIKPMLERRQHELVVFMLGTNFWNSKENPEGLRKLVELMNGLSRPPAVLVVTPPDHVKTKHHTESDPRVLEVIEQLSAASREQDLALWDFREAMGGNGSMWLFVQRGLAGADLYHLTSTGARIMGRRMAHALLTGYADHVQAKARAGCAP